MPAARSRMIDLQFTTDAMRAVFSGRSRVQRMLDFEAALARAEARAGLIPASAAAAIARHCRADAYDPAALATASRNAGNPAIPLVAALTRAVGGEDREAGRYVHWGATSQDVLDTGLVLQLREALALLDADLLRLGAALAQQAATHKGTVLAGRTLLQQALPVTLGQKLAGTLAAVQRHRARLARLRSEVLVVQFGGAAGTLASLGERALAVEAHLATELGLAVAEVPWHTQRDRVCEVAAMLGLVVATLGKLARDVALLAQTEVAEAFEPAAPGRGGSSTLPQKRNPVGCATALAAAIRVPNLVATMLAAAVQEHERGLGNWPAEWDTLPEICELCAGALAAMAEVVAGLEVDAQRMSANLDLTQGRIVSEAVQMALAPALGRDEAHALVAEACRKSAASRRPLHEALAAEPKVTAVVDAAALVRLTDPAGYLGASAAFVDRVLSAR